MKKNHILKEASVLPIITILFLSTVAVNGNIQINQIFVSESEVINPEDMQDEEYIYYYDPDTPFIHGIGLLGGTPPYEWKTAIRLTQVELAPYPDWYLIGVKVLHYEDAYQHSGEIEIYSEGNDTSPGELIISEPYYFDNIDWFRINLSTAVPIDGISDIWIAVTWNTTDYDDPAAADDGPAVDGKGDWVLLPGEDWEELQGYGLDYNWFIEGIVKENQPPFVEIINPREGYFHFSGIPLFPTSFDLIADTMSIGGFRLYPITINATDDFDNREDLIVKVYLNGKEQGNASYCCDWRLHEWFWTGWTLGTYNLAITAEDSFGAVGSAEMDTWNFCFLP